MDAQTMGNYIARRRKELGMTQKDLAEKLHVTDKAISRWERGIGLPDINLIEPLAQALDVSLLQLVQAETVPKEFISADDAEKMISDTISLSQKGKWEALAGKVTLVCVGIVCMLLLGFAVWDGNVSYPVGSVVTGLIAWAAPVWQMTLSRSEDTQIAAALSLGAALTSLTIQFYDLAHKVEMGDFSAIEDTVGGLCLVVGLFASVTLLLNLWMIRKKAKR